MTAIVVAEALLLVMIAALVKLMMPPFPPVRVVVKIEAYLSVMGAAAVLWTVVIPVTAIPTLEVARVPRQVIVA